MRSRRSKARCNASDSNRLYGRTSAYESIRWAHNLWQQVVSVVARLNIGSSLAETVNKRAASH